MTKKELLLYFGALIFALGISQMVLGAFINIKVHRFIIVFYMLFLFLRMSVNLNLKRYSILFLNVTVFFIAFLLSFNSYQNVFTDIQQLFWWLPFSILLVSMINTKDRLSFFFKKVTVFLTLFGVVISIVSLKKFLDLNNGIVWSSLTGLNGTDLGTSIGGSSLNKDYNVYSFGISFFIMSYKSCYEMSKRRIYKLAFFFLICLDMYLIFYSGSRRGLLLLILLLLLLPTNSFSKIKKINFSFLSFKTLIRIAAFYFLFVFSIGFLKNFASADTASTRIISRLATTQNFLNKSNNRTQRWDYSLEMYSNYDFFQLVFGDGFVYLKKFARYFGVKGEDHPHNFILSTLLYSGIIGTLIVLYMMAKILLNLKKNKLPLIFNFGFIFILILQLSSSNSFFTLNIAIFLLVLLLNFSEEKYLLGE
ncbi:O-antigen ligase family protein [uncultured Tenacibaculum sp.]|uniref:O-antigen ligase family protein n=1 Tax=uncultured Tenacibaculum sp. TaxID=174713 RepID=UPI0026077A30|nr:O-antigen ligase family protein [uncultured Tenacibaculum sp.]